MNWDTIKSYHLNSPKTFGEFVRTADDQAKYDVLKAHLAQSNSSLSESIFQKYFSSNNQDFIIVSNEFPYMLEPTIQHFILWIRPGVQLDDTRIQNVISDFCSTNFSQWICFQNKPDLQSVKSVEHWHIFCKV